MPASKIQDVEEVLRWFDEGWTYQAMCDEYLRKYNIETVPSLWSNFRRRRGLTRRIVRDDQLIPWAVLEEHRWDHKLQMLRLEARARAGEPIREREAVRHRNFIDLLNNMGKVVDYTPETGFVLVDREPGEDLVRRPRAHALKSARHAAD